MVTCHLATPPVRADDLLGAFAAGPAARDVASRRVWFVKLTRVLVDVVHSHSERDCIVCGTLVDELVGFSLLGCSSFLSPLAIFFEFKPANAPALFLVVIVVLLDAMMKVDARVYALVIMQAIGLV